MAAVYGSRASRSRGGRPRVVLYTVDERVVARVEGSALLEVERGARRRTGVTNVAEPVDGVGPPARATLVRHIGGSFTPRVAFEAHAASLPAFLPKPSFAF